MMNFDFLHNQAQLSRLSTACDAAEGLCLQFPSMSITSARQAMEYIVKAIYASLNGDYSGLTVFEMTQDPRFLGFVNDDILMNSIHYIRKLGNIAVHEGKVSQEDALRVLEELQFLAGEFCILTGIVDEYPEFQKPCSTASIAPVAAESKTQEKPSNITASPETSSELTAVLAARLRETAFEVHQSRNPEHNRRLYLAACLREAGWAVVRQAGQCMPGCATLNLLLDDGETVDYVMNGRDNRPLAIVEYIASAADIIIGRKQAIHKAEKLSEKYGYKPIVYYVNGYQTFIIDQLGYKPRRVFQFHTLEELELLKLRASMRLNISNPEINDTITNRNYQKEAIRSACHAFQQLRRHSLLVMATGTGKTRVAISLSDVLLKANWVKSILFLADRTSLVRQAHKNFNKLLPTVTTSIYSGSETERDSNARIIFSTYQTMIRLINDDTREFSVGRFDLIIIDEAHRSIFSKYAALFHYFDALMLGLTATPRSENNKSSYQMFQLPDGEPDFAYELEEAVSDGYLVGFSVLDRTTESLRRGLHYDELSEDEKEQLEDTFIEEDTSADLGGMVISAKEINKTKYINLGAIDAMLADLMQNGIHVNGGDMLGKSIIFAKSHTEAQYIVERFQRIYSNYDKDFCKLIDCQTDGCLTIIDSFGERDSMPQIAVSVDMMDTGVDVPDALNLVFFKAVHSKIKFLQMIGRGTRLSKDLFGPGEDKEGFLIFDYFDNFSYFRTHFTWTTREGIKTRGFRMIPQTQLINRCKLGIMDYLSRKACTPFEESYYQQLLAFFVETTRGLCTDDISVQRNLAYVDKYRTEEMWYNITEQKKDEIEEKLLPLFPSMSDSMKIKTFDLMMLTVEKEVPARAASSKDVRKIRMGFGNVFNKIDDMLREVIKLKNIPAVVEKESLILELMGGDYLLDNFSLEKCENARKSLRELMQFIPTDNRVYVLDFNDTLITGAEDDQLAHKKPYAEEVKDFVDKGQHVALSKLRGLDPLTDKEKEDLEHTLKTVLGTETDYAGYFGEKPMLTELRRLTGIAEEAVETKFGTMLNDPELNDAQRTFLNQIVSYVRENGGMAMLDLQRVSPFCDVDIMELFGTKIVYIKNLVKGFQEGIK